MKTIVTSTWIAGMFLALGACGTDSGSDGTGGAGGSSSSGASNTAGATAGKSSTAGSAGSTSGAGMSGGSATAGAGGTSSGGGGNAVCSPGTTTEAVFAYPDLLQNCGFEGKGELAGQGGFYSSIKLPAPIGPGDKFSFSVGVEKLSAGTMELWGGSAECGEAHEHFATVTVPAGGGEPGGVRCMTAEPKTGTYPYLIWVMHIAGEHGDVTMCPDVSCPGQ